MRVQRSTICNKSFSCGLTMLGRIKRRRTKDVARLGLAVAVAFLPFALAFAQEFSADMISRGADGRISKGKLYLTTEKERLDLTVELPAGKTVDTHMIIDRRQRMIYLVEPHQKTILISHVLQLVGNTSESGSSSSNPCEELMRRLNPVVARQQSTCRQVGRDMVNGRLAEKWQMESKWLGSGLVYLWVDPQIRTAIKWTLPDGSSGELRNIEVGSQPASLFELPANYHKQDLPL